MIDIDGLEGAPPGTGPYPPAGTPHYRFIDNQDAQGQWWRQVQAWDVDPNSLNQANISNSKAGGRGYKVYGSELFERWKPVAAPPTRIVTFVTVTNNTTVYSGIKWGGTPLVPVSSRNITAPSGGTITGASISLQTGGSESNQITVINVTTGATLFTSGMVATWGSGTGTITATLTGINPGDVIQVNQTAAAGNTNADYWTYTLTINDQTTNTTGPITYPTSVPTVGSPGTTVTPRVVSETNTNTVTSPPNVTPQTTNF